MMDAYRVLKTARVDGVLYMKGSIIKLGGNMAKKYVSKNVLGIYSSKAPKLKRLGEL